MSTRIFFAPRAKVEIQVWSSNLPTFTLYVWITNWNENVLRVSRGSLSLSLIIASFWLSRFIFGYNIYTGSSSGYLAEIEVSVWFSNFSDRHTLCLGTAFCERKRSASLAWISEFKLDLTIFRLSCFIFWLQHLYRKFLCASSEKCNLFIWSSNFPTVTLYVWRMRSDENFTRSSRGDLHLSLTVIICNVEVETLWRSWEACCEISFGILKIFRLSHCMFACNTMPPNTL